MCALGTICVILSISNITAILDSAVAPSNKEIHFLLSVGQFSESSYFMLFQMLPLATSNLDLASIISVIPLVTIIPHPV